MGIAGIPDDVLEVLSDAEIFEIVDQLADKDRAAEIVSAIIDEFDPEDTNGTFALAFATVGATHVFSQPEGDRPVALLRLIGCLRAVVERMEMMDGRSGRLS